MPGGTCEATAYHTLGCAATCVCLPLGQYHNMNERTGRISRETISLRDYDALLRLLVELGRRLPRADQRPSLRAKLDQLFDNRRHLIE